MTETLHARYAPDEHDAPVHAPLVPVDRCYPLREPAEAVGADAWPGEASWARAPVGTAFHAAGRLEPADRATTFRMIAGRETLFILIACPGRDVQDESLEVHVTCGEAADFPILAMTARPDGRWTAGLVARPYTPYHPLPLDPVPEGAVRCRVSSDDGGWRVLLALRRDLLGVPASGFFLNVVRRTGDGVFAWCDLWGGPPVQMEALGRAIADGDADAWAATLALPAHVAVGVNHLRLTRPDPMVTVRANGCAVPVDEEGTFSVPVRDRGPLDVELVHTDAGVVARYHADVPRPLLVALHEPFVPVDADKVACEVTLNLAGDEAVPVTLTCIRGDQRTDQQIDLPPGRHAVTLAVPAGDGDELTVEALVRKSGGSTGRSAPVSGRTSSMLSPDFRQGESRSTAGQDRPWHTELAARHWCAIGRSAEDVDRYRPDLSGLSARDLHWAVIADAVPLHRLRQAGCGAYGDADPRANAWWAQAFVYVPALLYKTAHPANPRLGDRRLLESAIMGMEFALRPTISQAQRVDPDNRSLQAFLLTYDLLKDDVEPARREYWAHELAHRSQGVVDRWLRAVDLACGLTSADCGTGSNHMAYHIANAYLAGDLYGHEDWKIMAARWLRRFAAHGAWGHFEERTGLPVNHYTWLSANGLAQYHARSGDEVVVPALEAFARHGTAITTAAGGTMALHDGRNSHHGGGVTGTFILSRTARGRAAARARLLGAISARPSTLTHETLWRVAEDAVHFITGPEEDFAADDEHVFNRGVIARRHGFHYGLSTIAVGAINGLYRLDPQNVLEVFHRSAGCILHGGNSALQPEAGSFCRPLSAGPTVRDLPAQTAPRADYLPITGAVKHLPDGHDVEVFYWSFAARLAVHVLSGERMRIVVTWRDLHGGAGPVVFNFFPGAARAGDLEADGRCLRFGGATIEASADFSVDTDFRLMNPYLYTFTYTHKPVRCWTALEPDVPFVLDIAVK